jgi:hypothetical protein
MQPLQGLRLVINIPIRHLLPRYFNHINPLMLGKRNVKRVSTARRPGVNLTKGTSTGTTTGSVTDEMFSDKSRPGGLARLHGNLCIPIGKSFACLPMRYLVDPCAGIEMMRVDRPRQRSPPCARYLVSRSAHFTIAIPARTGSNKRVYSSVLGRAHLTSVRRVLEANRATDTSDAQRERFP